MSSTPPMAVISRLLTSTEQYFTASRLRLVSFFILLLSATFLLRLRQYGWIVNDDGALYLYAARNFLDQGFSAALETYTWAYYSILVAYFDQLFFDDLVLSGWTLNFIFQCGQVYFLYRIGSLLHVRQPRLFWAMVLFVLSISFHNFRNYLMRDQGFLLFLFAGGYFSLLYLRDYSYRTLLLFVLSFLLAALFRIEAVILLLTGFLALIYLSRKYILGLFAIIFAFLAVFMLLSNPQSMEAVEHFANKLPGIAAGFSEQQDILESQLLSKHWHDYSGIGLFSLYFNSFVYYLLGSITIYLLGFFYFQKKTIDPSAKLIVVYGSTIILYCLFFLFSRGFLVFRYNLPLTYVLTLFSIVLVLSACARQARLARYVLALFIIVPLFKVFDAPSGSKRYLLEAQKVVEEMGLGGSKVYSNSLQVLLLNGVDYQVAGDLRGNKPAVLRKLTKPLKNNVAVIYYGDIKNQAVVAEENCLAYYKKHRSRTVSVYVANNEYCLADKS